MRVLRKKSKLTALVTFLLALIIQLTSIPAIPVMASGVENWDLQEQQGTYSGSDSIGYSETYIRVGDIDNFGNGWAGGFNPFKGEVGTYTSIDNSQSYNGTDNLSAVNTVNLKYNLPTHDSYYVTNARIEFYGTGFKSGNTYEVELNGKRVKELEDVLSLYALGDGQAQFITFRLPHRLLSSLESGASTFTIKAFDGDGNPAPFALDFLKLSVNFQGLNNSAIIQGETYLAETYDPNAPDGAQGIFVPWVTINAVGSQEAWYSEEDGHFDIIVPAGKVIIIVSKLGYKTQVIELNLKPGEQIEYDILMEYGGGYADVSIGAKDIDSIRNVRSIPKYLVADNLGKARVDKIFDSPIALTKDPEGKINPSVEFDIKGMQLTEKQYQFIKVAKPYPEPKFPGINDRNWKDLGEGTTTTIDPNTADAYPDFMWAEKGHITVRHYEYDAKGTFGKEIEYANDPTKSYVTGKKNVLAANSSTGKYDDSDDDKTAFFENDSNAAGKAMKVWGYIVLGAEMKKYEDLVFGIKANTGAYGYIDVGGSKIVFADGNSNATQVISEGKTVKLEKGKIYPIYMEWYGKADAQPTFVPVYKRASEGDFKQVPAEWFFASSNEGPAQKGQQFETSALFKEVAFPEANGYYYVAVRAKTAFSKDATHGLYGPFLIRDGEEEDYTIRLEPNQMTINVDQVAPVTAIIEPEGYEGNVEWTIINNKTNKKEVIEFDKDSTDLVKFVKGLAPGEVTIKATLDNGADAIAYVSVVEEVKGAISLPEYLYIKAGTSKDLEALVNLPNNSEIKWTIDGIDIKKTFVDENIEVKDSPENSKKAKNAIEIKGLKATNNVYEVVAKSANGKVESNVCKVYVYSGTYHHSMFTGEYVGLNDLFPGLPLNKPEEVEFNVTLGNEQVKIDGSNVKAIKEGSAKVTATIKASEDDEDAEDEVIETNITVFKVEIITVSGQVFPDRATGKVVFKVTDGDDLTPNKSVNRDLTIKFDMLDLKDVATDYQINNVQGYSIKDTSNKTFTVGIASEGEHSVNIFMDLSTNPALTLQGYNELVKEGERVPTAIETTTEAGLPVADEEEDLPFAYVPNIK